MSGAPAAPDDLDDPERPAGTLTYSFDKRLIEILKDSAVWGKIAIPVLMAFTSKYAVSLHENIAQLCNLSHKTSQLYPLEEFRNLLGVPPGRYKSFGELNKHVVKPAVAEVNALASFGITILPVKQGKKVKEIRVGWWRKDAGSLRPPGRNCNGRSSAAGPASPAFTEHVIDPNLRLSGHSATNARRLLKHPSGSPKISFLERVVVLDAGAVRP